MQDQPENTDFEKLLAQIKPLAEELNSLHQQMLALAMEEVHSILAEQSEDLKRIEHLLDTFLDLTMFGTGEKEFIAFLQYVYQVDEDCALDYFRLYKEEQKRQEEDFLEDEE